MRCLSLEIVHQKLITNFTFYSLLLFIYVSPKEIRIQQKVINIMSELRF